MDSSVRITHPVYPGQVMATTSPYYTAERDGTARGPGRQGQFHPHHGPSTSRGALSPRSKTAISHDDWTPSIARVPSNLSSATLENGRYHVDGIATSDHSNEDRNFSLDGGDFEAFAVFDGHDGPRAAGFASNFLMELFTSPSWKSVVASKPENITHALREFFKLTESEFFKSIRPIIEEKKALQAVIPSGMKSYQAYQLYPVEVARLQELEPKIAGGCTAAVAVICQKKLYVANVGDSRILLIRQHENGTLYAEQLTVDHGTNNESELKRLEALGLDPKELIKMGRLGSQENTRSIGDYTIKEGYRDVDVLSHARQPPGTAIPYVSSPVDIDSSFRYLVVMSDGVYKSIEAGFQDANSIEPNKVLIAVIEKVMRVNPNFQTVSDRVLERVARIHQDTYQRGAAKDPRSPIAVTCRKRDDMTLLTYKFPHESAV